MCLDSIKEHYDNPSMTIIDGWKQFNVSSTFELTFIAYPLEGKQGHKVPMNKWITATPNLIKDLNGKEYYTGFHVYVNEKEAKKYQSSRSNDMHRVYIRKVTCLGMQDGLNVYIAQEMYVPSDPNGWPPKDGEIPHSFETDDFVKEAKQITKELKKKKSLKETVFGKPGNA